MQVATGWRNNFYLHQKSKRDSLVIQPSTQSEHTDKRVLYRLHSNSLIPGSAVEAPTWRGGDEWRPFSVLSWILMVT